MRTALLLEAHRAGELTEGELFARLSVFGITPGDEASFEAWLAAGPRPRTRAFEEWHAAVSRGARVYVGGVEVRVRAMTEDDREGR